MNTLTLSRNLNASAPKAPFKTFISGNREVGFDGWDKDGGFWVSVCKLTDTKTVESTSRVLVSNIERTEMNHKIKRSCIMKAIRNAEWYGSKVISGTVTNVVKEKRHSRNGNPFYTVTIEEDNGTTTTMTTAPDAMVAYDISRVQPGHHAVFGWEWKGRAPRIVSMDGVTRIGV